MTQKWMQHALRDTQWQIQRQAVALGGLGLFIAIIMGALYLAQSSSLATLGRQLENLIAERNRLEQTNESLRADIAQLRSVPRLLARAKDLGFSESGNTRIEYIVVDGYNPNRAQITPILAVESAAPAPVYDETFTGWLQQQWDAFTGQFETFSEAE